MTTDLYEVCNYMNPDFHSLLITENLHRQLPFRGLKVELWEDRKHFHTVVRVYDSEGKMLLHHKNKTPAYAEDDPYHVKVRDCLDDYLLHRPLLRPDTSKKKFTVIHRTHT